nr:atherin-like [Camelus dromedarius]
MSGGPARGRAPPPLPGARPCPFLRSPAPLARPGPPRRPPARRTPTPCPGLAFAAVKPGRLGRSSDDLCSARRGGGCCCCSCCCCRRSGGGGGGGFHVTGVSSAFPRGVGLWCAAEGGLAAGPPPMLPMPPLPPPPPPGPPPAGAAAAAGSPCAGPPRASRRRALGRIGRRRRPATPGPTMGVRARRRQRLGPSGEQQKGAREGRGAPGGEGRIGRMEARARSPAARGRGRPAGADSAEGSRAPADLPSLAHLGPLRRGFAPESGVVVVVVVVRGCREGCCFFKRHFRLSPSPFHGPKPQLTRVEGSKASPKMVAKDREPLPRILKPRLKCWKAGLAQGKRRTGTEERVDVWTVENQRRARSMGFRIPAKSHLQDPWAKDDAC